MKKIVLVLAMAFGVSSLAFAQGAKPVTQGDMVSTTSVITAIDSGNRLVTLKNEDGTTDVIYCGPEVKRFDALKVGDKVTFRYHESVVYNITKTTDSAPTVSLPQIVRSAGAKPGATISQQATAVVTVAAIDPKIPSVTISTSDGNKMSFKVENKKNIEGIKAGDKVQITYTQAFAITVEAPGK
jgi:Cu/Ag efflux protein CusF